jgi:AAA+ superfamily predicted ATPase
MLRELLSWGSKRDLLELITPRRTFADVILPEKTRRALYDALMQIDKHRLIFGQWGLGERHTTGTGLAFNFAGPPGTGKTICAEAVARALGKKLYKVRYSELQSCWAGETGKNVLAIFRDARQSDAVLFFDEADSIAGRRFTGMNWGYEREANNTVNILLKELEDYDGVVIFATNLASNFDPAFERRIRTHILFEMPGVEEREKIWRVQIHPTKTPLAEDVDFYALAERYPISGGDIKNVVLKAAQMAAAADGDDDTKRITQAHLISATEQVRNAKNVMAQNLFGENGMMPPGAENLFAPLEGRLVKLEDDINLSRAELGVMETSIEALQDQNAREATALRDQNLRETSTLREQLERDLGAIREYLEHDLAGIRGQLDGDLTAIRAEASQAAQALREQSARDLQALRAQSTHDVEGLRTQSAHDAEALRAQSAQDTATLRDELAALRAEWRAWTEAQPTAWENRIDRLERATLIPLPRWASLSLIAFLLVLAFSIGGMVFRG